MAVSRSTLQSAATIQWASGTPFNGWVLLIAVLPNISGAVYNKISLRDSSPKMNVPTRIRVAIREGVLDSSAKVWQSSSLVPTNVVYSAWFYDDTNTLIATGSALFTITTDPFTLTIPSLSDPTTAIVSPTPETAPNTLIQTVTYTAPSEEDVGGTKNGVNTAFTISKVGNIFFLVLNGQVLTSGVDYTNVGTTITMISTNLPNTGDQFKAVIF